MPESPNRTVEGTLRWSHIGYLVDMLVPDWELPSPRPSPPTKGMLLLNKPVTATGTMIEIRILEVASTADFLPYYEEEER